MKKFFAFTFFLLILVASYFCYDAYQFLTLPANKDGEEIVFRIEKGATFDRVAWGLKKAGALSDVDRFRLLGRYKKALGSIRAGDYSINTSWTPPQILHHLTKGPALLFKLSIIEGLSWWETAKAIEEQGFATYEDFVEVIHDKDFLKAHAIPFGNAEGFLLPETYLLGKPRKLDREQAEYIASLMVKTFWQKNLPAWKYMQAEKPEDHNYGVAVAHIGNDIGPLSPYKIADFAQNAVFGKTLSRMEEEKDNHEKQDKSNFSKSPKTDLSLDQNLSENLPSQGQKEPRKNGSYNEENKTIKPSQVKEATQVKNETSDAGVKNSNLDKNNNMNTKDTSKPNSLEKKSDELEVKSGEVSTPEGSKDSGEFIKNSPKPKNSPRSNQLATNPNKDSKTNGDNANGDQALNPNSSSKAKEKRAHKDGLVEKILKKLPLTDASKPQDDQLGQTSQSSQSSQGNRNNESSESRHNIDSNQNNQTSQTNKNSSAEDSNKNKDADKSFTLSTLKADSKANTDTRTEEELEEKTKNEDLTIVPSSEGYTTVLDENKIPDKEDKNLLSDKDTAKLNRLKEEWPYQVVSNDAPPLHPGYIKVEDLKKVVILASLVEKETGVPKERPKVAGVFNNRLELNMLLQCDPTIIYGIGPKFSGSILRSQIQDEKNKYNTYVHAGLPPGPISSFGVDAFVSAVFPQKHKYLYFVATGQGKDHTFSRTLREHNQAVRVYRSRTR